MEQVVYGIHTGTCKHVITLKESNSLKQFFGVDINKPMEDETHFYDKGITKLWIQQTPTKRGLKCYLFMQINFARVLGIGTHKIMPYSVANMKKVVKAVNKVLKLLPLLDKNNKFQDWTVERFDPAFDIYEQHPPLLMQSLNDSLDLSKRIKQCERLPIPNKTPEQLKSESMRFGNNSYVYNVYVKSTEVLEKAEKNGRTVPQEEIEEIQDILRIERQNHKSAVKELLPHKKVNDLAEDKVRADILRIMVDEMELFFGKDDFYSREQIAEEYHLEHETDILKLKGVMVRIAENSLEDVAEKWMQGIYNRITAEFPRPPDRRQYNRFPIPHQTGDGRYKATITLYDADSGRKQTQVAGKTLADYENKVFGKLASTYIANRAFLKSDDSAKKDLALKSADSIVRFCKVAKTDAVIQGTKKFIKNCKLNNHMLSDTVDNP